MLWPSVCGVLDRWNTLATELVCEIWSGMVAVHNGGRSGDGAGVMLAVLGVAGFVVGEGSGC